MNRQDIDAFDNSDFTLKNHFDLPIQRLFSDIRLRKLSSYLNFERVGGFHVQGT